MTGVDPVVAVHQLSVDPHYKPIKQKKRTFSEEKGEAIREEVDKLLGADAIRELLFLTWLANVTAFGLKNAGSTYQRMVNNVFSTQIGPNMKIYVDDMLIKSRKREDHQANLRESFKNLRRNKLRLNLDKCVFGLTSRKFFGYMIIQRGIKPGIGAFPSSKL
ncbi:hypothetical protein LIER_19612 [Lithospermum erythrorhizon]|uniref:Reverse transcriptase domain-containing protein n=1 Tax=Lithospermum erythrorhizon TaxID=34254 RepID=A0AAV3QJH0_LITER